MPCQGICTSAGWPETWTLAGGSGKGALETHVWTVLLDSSTRAGDSRLGNRSIFSYKAYVAQVSLDLLHHHRLACSSWFHTMEYRIGVGAAGTPGIVPNTPVGASPMPWTPLSASGEGPAASVSGTPSSVAEQSADVTWDTTANCNEVLEANIRRVKEMFKEHVLNKFGDVRNYMTQRHPDREARIDFGRYLFSLFPFQENVEYHVHEELPKVDESKVFIGGGDISLALSPVVGGLYNLRWVANGLYSVWCLACGLS